MSDISNNRQLLCNSKEQKLLSKNLEYYIKTTANGYTCLEKLTTEKCKQQAKQPEKKILKIKIL